MTASLVAVTDAIKGVVDTNAGSLGITQTYYGDQELIHKTPAVCIEPGDRQAEWRGTSQTVTYRFAVTLMIYHSQLQDTSTTRREADQFAEAIADVLHQDIKLGGLVYQSLVTEIVAGYAQRGRVFLRSTRMIWTGESVERV